MKRISSSEAQAKVRLLNSVIGYRREIEKIEKDLKTWLREAMGEHNSVIVGDYAVYRKDLVRRDLDKDLLFHKLGDLKEFEKETHYQVLDIQLMTNGDKL